jgi:hypothetical protein
MATFPTNAKRAVGYWMNVSLNQRNLAAYKAGLLMFEE